MADSQKTLSVSKAATLCGVGRTTVGYWIRSKKINAARPGRNYNKGLPIGVFIARTRQRFSCTGCPPGFQIKIARSV